MNKQNYHYSSLDLLRGISGYGVAICHFYAFLYSNIFFEYMSFLFVEFFFVLSGYVLYPQLMKVFENNKNLLNFYLRRWLRTIPLYVICLLMISLIFGKIISLDFVKYLFFLQDLKPEFLEESYYPIVWSLSIEEFFYLLFPIVLIICKKDLIKKLIVLFIALLVLKFFYVEYFDLKFMRTGTFIRFDAILLGFLSRYFFEKIEKNKILFIFFSISLFLFLYNQEWFLENKSENIVKLSLIILMQLISISALYFLISIEKLSVIKKIKIFSSLISKQTYSVYLTHMIFIYVFLNLELNGFIEFVFYMFGLFATSSFLYYFVEEPILKNRPKLKYD